VDTVARLAALRAAMKNTSLTGGMELSAYITLISDDHGTSGSAWDARVTYISGFSGSNGFALVTTDQAAVWTDGRYFLQAEQQMDCAWILMKIATAGYPTGPDWLAEILPENSTVGAYGNYVSISTWKSYEDVLKAKGIEMVQVDKDLVDHIWTDTDRPEKPQNPLIVHTLEFAGLSYQQKLVNVRKEMETQSADCLVLTILEESAWLFNLRGTDRTDSLFYGYALVFKSAPSKLFINNPADVLANDTLRDHLNLNADGLCQEGVLNNDCIQLHNYTDVEEQITAVNSTYRVWLDPTSSYAIYAAVLAPTNYSRSITSVVMIRSPIALMKSIKNDVERTKFFDCILRDSAAVIEFVANLEKEINEGKHWTEISASEDLKKIRNSYQYNMGLSFATISAVGPNAAVIHYRPLPETDRKITNTEIYLLDSGGQYLDGTTDVTRTFHFGTPKDIEKEAYTRVLMGAIDLAMTVWPEGLYGSDLDVRARAPLWQHGWDYNHGTGHGIGYFLSVHEGPGRINIGFSESYSTLYEGMFFSDEPGYYEDNSFGIRLETLVSVVKANTTFNFDGHTYLAFKPATLVPFEPKLIKYNLLSPAQIQWLDDYHKLCEKQTGDYLKQVRNNELAYKWLTDRTMASHLISSSSINMASPILLLLLTIYVFTFGH